MDTQICKPEGFAETCDGEVGAVMWAMQSFKDRFAAGEDKETTADTRARQTLDKMPELYVTVEGPNRTVGGKRARILELVDAELIRIWLFTTAALSQSEGTLKGNIGRARWSLCQGVPWGARSVGGCSSRPV